MIPKRYERTPTVITAVEFQPDWTVSPVELELGLSGWLLELEEGEARVAYTPGQPKAFQVWNEIHATWIGFAAGDFLRIDDADDVYPIDADTFMDTYTEVTDGEGTE